MAFKLGSEKREFKNSDNVKKFTGGSAENYQGTPIIRDNLEDGVYAEAYMDGTIGVDHSLDLNSKFGRKVLKHEQQHIEDFESGRAAYNDSAVLWDGNWYIRKEINGVKVVDGPNGRWPEGDPNHPWEQVAIDAEKKRV
tara:strand:- start:96 stop:512 length:417 start_codon:yes stop_codon:yes gene_type:complete